MEARRLPQSAALLGGAVVSAVIVLDVRAAVYACV